MNKYLTLTTAAIKLPVLPSKQTPCLKYQKNYQRQDSSSIFQSAYPIIVVDKHNLPVPQSKETPDLKYQ